MRTLFRYQVVKLIINSGSEQKKKLINRLILIRHIYHRHGPTHARIDDEKNVTQVSLSILSKNKKTSLSRYDYTLIEARQQVKAEAWGYIIITSSKVRTVPGCWYFMQACAWPLVVYPIHTHACMHPCVLGTT